MRQIFKKMFIVLGFALISPLVVMADNQNGDGGPDLGAIYAEAGGKECFELDQLLVEHSKVLELAGDEGLSGDAYHQSQLHAASELRAQRRAEILNLAVSKVSSCSDACAGLVREIRRLIAITEAECYAAGRSCSRARICRNFACDSKAIPSCQTIADQVLYPNCGVLPGAPNPPTAVAHCGPNQDCTALRRCEKELRREPIGDDCRVESIVGQASCRCDTAHGKGDFPVLHSGIYCYYSKMDFQDSERRCVENRAALRQLLDIFPMECQASAPLPAIPCEAAPDYPGCVGPGGWEVGSCNLEPCYGDGVWDPFATPY